MRGKFEQRLQRRSGKSKAYKRPYGGKVLQRLLAYLDQRSTAMSAAAVATLRVPQSVQRTLGFTAAPKPSKGARGAKAGKRPLRARALADAKRYATAMAQAAAALAPQHAAAAAPGAPAVWQPLGPTVIPNGQTSGNSTIAVIGRVSCIAIDPRNPRHLLLGAAGGGVWETADTGATWAARTDAMPTTAIGAIAFDPTDPRKVYAGSGEGNFYFNLGAGVYGSTDGGTTWSVLASDPFMACGFFDLVVDPKDPSVLYAGIIDYYGQRSGFYRSPDGGVNWKLTRAGLCWSISVHPNGGTVELLATFADGLFLSTKGGDSFAPVAIPSTPSGAWTRLAVTRVAGTPDIAYLFGAIGTDPYPEPYLWRRAGGNWTQITSLPPVDRNDAWTAQAQYDWHVATAPDDAQIFLGAIELYQGTPSGATWRFTAITSIHPDQHCLAFSPGDPKVVYAGSDGGLFRSPDGGTTWDALNNGLAITEIEYIAADPNTSQWLMAGTQDNGTLRFTGSSAWDQIAQGDGGECGVNVSNPDEVYHSYFWDSKSGLLGFESSSDKGLRWSRRDVKLVNAIFYPPVEVSGATVAVGANSALLSRDKAVHWTTVPLGLPQEDCATAMHLTSPNTLLVGTRNGQCARLDWNGMAWQLTALTSPRAGYISSLRVHPTNSQRVWVTISYVDGNAAMVYRSDNGGKSWTPCRNGLRTLPMNAVTLDPSNADRAWVAADLGVYETRDGGASWTSISGGLPNAMAADLHYHAKDRRLICGTRNRGAWALDV